VAPILRAGFSAAFTTSGTWNDANAALCFLCHDRNRLLTQTFAGGARTNFYQQNGRDNLHWYHLTNKQVTGSCLSCHFDIHSNRTAGNTRYAWVLGGQTLTSLTPPAGVKSHLVNFAPDVLPLDFDRPRWLVNTQTGQRQCNLACHGRDMRNEPYQPPSGDEPSHTY
jgi:hypothetical protein